MSGQPSQFDEYPAHGVVSASAALVTAWSALENFHSDLVVVGGLAIYFHIQHQASSLPGSLISVWSMLEAQCL